MATYGSAPATPISPAEAQVEYPAEQFGLGSFENSKARICSLLSDWNTEVINTEYRRKVRNISVDVELLRNQGYLKPDETLIPNRVVNTNIEREKAPYVAFTTQSDRRAVFKPKNASQPKNVRFLEDEFTRVVSYDGWELAHYRCLDGAQTHGWDFVEIKFEPLLPCKFFVEHCGHENVIFPLDAREIEDCEIIILVKHPTVSRLKSFITKHGFDPVEVEKVVSQHPRPESEAEKVSPEDATREIYKIFFKYQGQVYVAWYGGDQTSKWLVPPKPLYMGVTRQTVIQVPILSSDPVTGVPIETMQDQVIEEDEPETSYPLVILPYLEGEEAKIAARKGRVFLDEHKQEGATALISSFVNTAQRSSNLHVAPETSDESGEPKQTGNIVGNGMVWNRKVHFFNTPAPDGAILKGLEILSVQNSQEALQVDYAVKNREDSRKTAQEIKSAERDQALINGVQVTLYSIYLRRVYQKIWRIIQSQARQNKLEFCVREELDPFGQPIRSNDLELIEQDYELLASGDVDVIKRQEKLQAMKEFWPIVQSTPIGLTFLADLLRLAFPNDGERYANELIQGIEAQRMQQARQQMMLEQFATQNPQFFQQMIMNQQQQNPQQNPQQ